MNINYIKEQIKVIEAKKRDYETAHARENALHKKVLRAIAHGAENSQELAREALRTVNISFPRRCA
jgi:hypothetical protein